ncbi:hypothetical protein F3Y22_tig00111614pilonHSYRG00061 [Hibiscus syriacus]|uniref:Cation/H(+) antiporter C-terminal domain-containing protein n=1 Tax=Hibiscus syriacus TaxID=106335 RepID=A0A6A2YJF7_HIBSY|nr:hypothetical protein F3Y22_tig00111614pilonHSYRG00061 [Hibiscus syriacus]
MPNQSGGMLGMAHKYTGKEDRDSRKLWISQRGYVEKILERFAMSNAKPVSIPLANHFMLSSEQCPKIDREAKDMTKVPYSNVVGCLMYAMVCTRPDLAHDVSQVSKYMSKPGYVDSDYEVDLDNRRSITRYVFTLGGGPICWKSTVQSVVALSTTEVEYLAAAEATKEILWLTGLVNELGVQQGGVQLLCDNQTIIHLAKNHVYRTRTKHIDVRFHKIRELVASGEILFQNVHIDENVADMFTKPVTTGKFLHCLDLTTPEGRPIEEVYVVIILMLAFASSMFTHELDHSPLLGAFLIGLVVPDGQPLGSALIPLRDSLVISLIMSNKGIVELSYFSTFKDSERVDTCRSSKCNYNPSPGEVPLLPCFKKICKPEHVSALVDVLDITCPTKESPNIVYVLHLIELVGRDSPVFIAHQKHENRVTGILVDWRRKLLTSSASTYNVGIIFLGGKDDQEALTLVKRMARDPRVNLTVIHLIPDENCRNVIDWDSMLDAETLKDIKQNDDSHGCCVKYIIQVSKDGQQSSRIIQSIAGDYDLIIVGRRYGVDSVQTIGLSEWSEFPELGVIGDLLESIDISSRASILVVQQHNYVD